MQKENLKEIVIHQQKRYPLTQRRIVERSCCSRVRQYFDHPHAVIVKGVRRCGKSTLLHQLLRQYPEANHYYLNFEDERLLNFTVSDFNSLYEVFVELLGERQIFYFDEIQNILSWEVYIRRMQDSGFKFFLTGSNASLLSKEMGTKLTGRHVDIELFPFSFSEFLQFHAKPFSPNDFYDAAKRGLLRKFFSDYLQNGGMPEYLCYQQPFLLNQVYEDILFRDVITRYEIKDVKALRKLGLYLVSNMARPFSFNKLKNILGMGSVNTVKNYISYLEDCYLLFTINQFSYSLNQQIVANKKVYVIDNGLANSIAFQFSKNQGQFLENLVFIELKRRNKNIFYYKTENNLEVDFILRHGREVEALIQVTFDIHDETTKNREIKALLKAMEETHLKEALMLTNDHAEQLKIGDKTIIIMPVYRWLLEDDTQLARQSH